MKKRLTLSIFAILLLTILITALSSVRNVGAVSNSAIMYLEAEGSGKITGYVGQAITPYRFTLTIKKGPAGSEATSFKKAYAAGTDVTSWFAGTCDPKKNVFRRLPVGLTVKTVNAINIGDTSATFEVSGTPYMGSSNWLLIAIPQSVFDGNDDHKNSVEVNNGIQMAISRTNSNVTLKMSTASLQINYQAHRRRAHIQDTVLDHRRAPVVFAAAAADMDVGRHGDAPRSGLQRRNKPRLARRPHRCAGLVADGPSRGHNPALHHPERRTHGNCQPR